jgi:hypothetical protein
MDRRALLQKAASFGLVSGIAGTGDSRRCLAQSATGVAPQSGTAEVSDWHEELTRRIAALEERGGGTLELGDGVYEISRPLLLPISVSMVMTPNAVVRAKKGFQGDAVVIKGGGNKSRFSPMSGWIRGGIIDGNLLPITGLRVEGVGRLEVADLEILNATYKGVHMLKGGYERNLTRVRCDVSLDAHYAPGSIGIHYEGADNKVLLAHVIGYETGVRSDDASNWFTLVHVWNADLVQGPMLYCFYCNGDNNTFNQCYADSPTTAGFYVSRPTQSFMQCRIFYSRWAKDHGGVGFLITPEGKDGNYIGTAIYARDNHRLAKEFDGDLEGACILGTSTLGDVDGGLQNQIPSGDSTTPPLNLAGTGFRLSPQQQQPQSQDGTLGEVRWVDNGDSSALWVKTSKGWKKCELV